jgi:hypothetical protein
MPLPEQITVDEYGEMLCDWLRSQSNRARVKDIASKVKYKYYLFSQKKNLKIIEEIMFLNISIIIHVVNIANDNEKDIRNVIDSFLAKLREGPLSIMAAGDTSFKQRYAERLDKYFEVLRGANPEYTLANEFLRNLYNSPPSILDLEKNAYLTASIIAPQLSLVETLKKITLAP